MTACRKLDLFWTEYQVFDLHGSAWTKELHHLHVSARLLGKLWLFMQKGIYIYNERNFILYPMYPLKPLHVISKNFVGI